LAPLKGRKRLQRRSAPQDPACADPSVPYDVRIPE